MKGKRNKDQVQTTCPTQPVLFSVFLMFEAKEKEKKAYNN